MKLEDLTVGKIFLNNDGITFRYIFKIEEDYKKWVYINSHNLGKKHEKTAFYDCDDCNWQRLHMFRKNVVREATPEEYKNLQPLVERFEIDLENAGKKNRQLMLESYTETELLGELERRKNEGKIYDLPVDFFNF
jgi:hypothetical protein